MAHMRDFTRGDWYGFCGAERPDDGREPKINEADVLKISVAAWKALFPEMPWNDDEMIACNMKDGTVTGEGDLPDYFLATIIVDRNVISISSPSGADDFILFDQGLPFDVNVAVAEAVCTASVEDGILDPKWLIEKMGFAVR